MMNGGGVMDNLLTGFYLLEFGSVIVVGLFWLQIFIRGALERAFKFEYITYSIITICLVHFYFTYLIWQENKEVLTLSSYFLLGLSTFKAWKWITNRTDWDKMETQFGVQTIEKLVRDDGVYIRGKGLLVGLVKLFGARNFYYGLWVFVTLIACLTFIV